MILWLALSLAHQAAAQPEIPVPAALPQPSPAYLQWSGWGYLNGKACAAYRPFAAPGENFDDLLKSASPGTPKQMRIRSFIFGTANMMETMPNGVRTIRYGTFGTRELTAIDRALQRLPLELESLSGQKLAVQSETRRLPVPIRVSLGAVAQPEGAALNAIVKEVKKVVEPRFNGGLYEANDRVYRGPFGLVLVFVPMTVGGQGRGKVVDLNGTPTMIVPVSKGENFLQDGAIDLRILKMLPEAFAVKQASLGLPPTGNGASITWDDLAFAGALSAARETAFFAHPTELNLAEAFQHEFETKAYISGDVQLTFNNDLNRGQILSYQETSPFRDGGAGLAVPADGSPIANVAKTPVLTFWARSTALDSIAIKILGSSTAYIVLGRRPVGPLRPAPIGRPSVADEQFSADGQWHQISVDLKSLLGANGVVTAMAICAPPESPYAMRETLGPIKYDFSDFSFGNDAPTPIEPSLAPSPDSADRFERAAWAANAPIDAKLALLLTDSFDVVKLNAAVRIASNPPAFLLPQLQRGATYSFNNFVATECMNALYKIGSDDAIQTLSLILKQGISDPNKASAAMVLARSKNPALAPQLIALVANRNIEARLACAKALSMLPGPAAAQIEVEFVDQTDPQLKLIALKATDPSDAHLLQNHALWASINEPSDAVRAAACELLLRSPDPALSKQGLVGLHDDSWWVCMRIANYLAAHPSLEAKSDLISAFSNPSARVRSAALTAYLALPQKPNLADLAPILQDDHPLVELNLVRAVKDGKIALPSSVLTRLKTSPDPRVVDLLQQLR